MGSVGQAGSVGAGHRPGAGGGFTRHAAWRARRGGPQMLAQTPAGGVQSQGWPQARRPTPTDFETAMNENELTHAIAREHINLASGLLAMMVPQAEGAGIGLKGLDGRYRLANPVLESLAGQAAGTVVGKTDDELFTPAAAAVLHDGDQAIARGAANAEAEIELTAGNQALRCQSVKFPVPGPDGTLLMIGTVLLPATSQQTVDGMLQSLERLRRNSRELQQLLTSLDHEARTDRLTGAWNRRRLDEALVNEMDRLHRYDHPLSLLLIGLDGFQQLNAELGTVAGDHLLVEVATVLQASLRPTDALARWNDELFAVLCANTTQSTAGALAAELLDRVATARFTSARSLTLSIGVAECGPDETREHWFQRADGALFKARLNGRNRVEAAEPPPRETLGERLGAGFVQLSWRAAYECGHPVIDAQHRGLFDDANRLLVASLERRPADEVTALIDTLVDHVVRHFQDEEALIAEAGFPGAEEHAIIHRNLLDQAADVTNRYQAGTVSAGDLFQFLAYELVARHMLGADREFFAFVKAPA